MARQDWRWEGSSHRGEVAGLLKGPASCHSNPCSHEAFQLSLPTHMWECVANLWCMVSHQNSGTALVLASPPLKLGAWLPVGW